MKIGDVVRYSRSAARQYGLTKEARQRTAMVTAVHDGYVTAAWNNGGGDRNFPNWALEVVSQPTPFVDDGLSAWADAEMGIDTSYKD